MTREAEIEVASAIAALQKSGVVFLCAYGFPGDTECFVEGMGDQNGDNARNLRSAIDHHFRQKGGMRIDPF